MVFDFSLLQISCSELSEVARSGGVDNKIVCNIYDVNGVSSLFACENTITQIIETLLLHFRSQPSQKAVS